MTYKELINHLSIFADEKYAAFHTKLLVCPNKRVLGVRVPILRKIAKRWQGSIGELMMFPDEFYEVTFLKLTVVSNLEYEEFLLYCDDCVKLIDNWACCDSFKPKCIASHKEEFLPYVQKYFEEADERYKEFSERFAIVTLLNFYIEKEYLPLIGEYLKRATTEKYYVHMAAAWLTAEVLVKHYEEGMKFLNHLDGKTRNKAIQKAKESYRISKEQKDFLDTLKYKKQ